MKLPLHPACRLLTSHAAGLWAIDKAEGVLSHPNREGDRPQALLDLPYDSARECFAEGAICWHLLNRLDGPTSGVILLADNESLAAVVRAAFKVHAVEKTYAALVKGVPARPQDRWQDHLQTGRGDGGLRTRVVRGKPNAITEMELKQTGAGQPARSLLLLRPATGRTHQLRVQCASRRLPIVGDATYGDFAFNREARRQWGTPRLFLHSWRTRLQLEFKGNVIRFAAESPLPEAFSVALQG